MTDRTKKLLLVIPAAVVIAGLAALLALAAAPDPDDVTAAGLGGKRKAKPACKPNVSYVFEGPLAAVATDSLTMDISAANRHARPFVGQQVAMAVNAQTRIVRDEVRAGLVYLEEGDGLNVHVRDCKRSDPAAVVLLARRVEATSPPPPPAEETVTEPAPGETVTEPAP